MTIDQVQIHAGNAYLKEDITELNNATNFDLQDANGNPNPNNVLYRFNSVEGGIVPRGTSIVGMDLRKTKLRPLYVPDPTARCYCKICYLQNNWWLLFLAVLIL